MHRIYSLSLTYGVVLAFIYGLFQSNQSFMSTFSNVIFPLTSGISLVTATFLLKKYGYSWSDKFQRIWLATFVGVALIFISDTLWTILVLIRGETFPLEVGILQLGVFAAFFLALFWMFQIFRLEVSWKELITFLIVLTAVGAAISYVFLVPFVFYNEELMRIALRIFIPFLDLALLTLSLLTLLTFWKGKLSIPFFFISFGIILNIVADVMFGYAELHRSFYLGHPLELFWLWSYIALTVALYTFERKIRI